MKPYIQLLVSLFLFSCSKPALPEGEWVLAQYDQSQKEAAYQERILIRNGKIETEWVDYTLEGRTKITKTYTIDSVIVDTVFRKYFMYIAKDDKGKYFTIDIVLLPDGSIRQDAVIYKSDGATKEELNGWLKKGYDGIKTTCAAGKLFTPKKDFEKYKGYPKSTEPDINFYFQWTDSIYDYMAKYPDSINQQMLMTRYEIGRKLMQKHKINPYEGIYKYALTEGSFRNDSELIEIQKEMDKMMTKAYKYPYGTYDVMNFRALEWTMGVNTKKE